jgi:hypothetical protein
MKRQLQACGSWLVGLGIAAVVGAGGCGEVAAPQPGETGAQGPPGPAGMAGPAGAAGLPGASLVFTTGPGSNMSFPGDEAWHVIATLDIPADEAGQYLVMFSAGLYNSFSDRFAYGGCRIQTPAGPSPGFGWTIGAAHASPATQATTFVMATVPV